MNEIWKDVVGYEGPYRVNQYGDIWSLIKNKRLKYSISNAGYKQYNLYKDKKAHIMTAHRAVAMAFIPNPNNLPLINHKDEDKLNCYYENLEWCTHLYNTTYNGVSEKRAESARLNYGTKFYVYDTNFNFIEERIGIRKFAREHGLWEGSFASILNKNNDGYKHYSYHGFIPSLVPLKINKES